jgi:hypothetical protein
MRTLLEHNTLVKGVGALEGRRVGGGWQLGTIGEDVREARVERGTCQGG